MTNLRTRLRAFWPIALCTVVHACCVAYAFRMQEPAPQQFIGDEFVVGFVVPFLLAVFVAVWVGRYRVPTALLITLPGIVVCYVQLYRYVVDTWSQIIYRGGFYTIRGLVADPRHLSAGPFDPLLYKMGSMEAAVILATALLGGALGSLVARKRLAPNNSVEGTGANAPVPHL